MRKKELTGEKKELTGEKKELTGERLDDREEVPRKGAQDAM